MVMVEMDGCPGSCLPLVGRPDRRDGWGCGAYATRRLGRMGSQRGALPEPIAIDNAKGNRPSANRPGMSRRGYVPATYEFEGGLVAQYLRTFAIHLVFGAS